MENSGIKPCLFNEVHELYGVPVEAYISCLLNTWGNNKSFI